MIFPKIGPDGPCSVCGKAGSRCYDTTVPMYLCDVHARVPDDAAYPERLVDPCVLAGCPEGGLVLDPFAGSGTTGVVALKRNRSFIGIDNNPAYIEIAQRRLSLAAPLFSRPWSADEPAREEGAA